MFDLGILKSVSFKIPVISIGNLTVGGTGKTPHVEYLTEILHEKQNIAVLSRGYKRKTSNFLLVKRKSRVSDVGDEPLQIRQKFPDVHVAVNKDRVEGIKKLKLRFNNLDVVILDDAFQHRYVKPGLSILLVDYNRPVYDDTLLPAGNLREPLASMRRANIIIVTKCPDELSSAEKRLIIDRLHLNAHQDLYFTSYEYGPLTRVFGGKHKKKTLTLDQLESYGASVMIVTGIANPSPLRKFLGQQVRIDEEITFPDHHFFTGKDISLMKLKYDAIDTKKKYIIITEKDAVRLREVEVPHGKFRKAFYYIPIKVRFHGTGQKSFDRRIRKFINS